MFTKELIQSLPKADLHRHFDGCIRPESVLELATEQHITLPTNDLTQLKSMIMVSNDCQSLREYLRAFDIIGLILQSASNITRTMFEVCEDAFKDGITYVEFRFAPIQCIIQGLTYHQVMDAVIEGIKQAEDKYPIVVRLIVCGMRQLSGEKSMEAAKLAVEYMNNYVVGFDLAGPEDGNPPTLHKEACDYCHEHGLSVTIHAGESAGYTSVDQALDCHAQRIGHGVHSIDSEETMKRLERDCIAIEACVTSNTQTKTIQSLGTYPLRTFLKHNIKVTFNTDNTVVSNCILSSEIKTFCDLYDLTSQELHDILLSSFDVAFIRENNMKNKIMKDADEKLKKLLKL
ncbi:adenosine deaminase, putative [Entamoeba invadens IP1]|uniref:adenosine deaminase n=1 Tax=Entamoeba invadens IP1 TaxID=370355 RepID=A0A0A1U1W8_ENTIV|nr:adenosine deaminase, putative [Entamoeba invadens IP1]ELP88023.1 adenosine deaminase, putative [Entamoeba invadens IP1]|eukprot:XP_004254794.1 adenosine deaminase, putative [Entamoeba invadens IP1]